MSKNNPLKWRHFEADIILLVAPLHLVESKYSKQLQAAGIHGFVAEFGTLALGYLVRPIMRSPDSRTVEGHQVSPP